jgi:hypothetical protein
MDAGARRNRLKSLGSYLGTFLKFDARTLLFLMLIKRSPPLRHNLGNLSMRDHSTNDRPYIYIQCVIQGEGEDL